MTGQQEYPGGEILVKVDAGKDQKAGFEISYIVSNAGWFPSYDIRAKNINEPIELVYKANVRQDTKEDWRDVKLKFSSSEPNVSGVAPVLKPYYLNYNIPPPAYHRNVNMVSGTVFDSYQNPVHGASGYSQRNYNWNRYGYERKLLADNSPARVKPDLLLYRVSTTNIADIQPGNECYAGRIPYGT
jgi:hypothetical protein